MVGGHPNKQNGLLSSEVVGISASHDATFEGSRHLGVSLRPSNVVVVKISSRCRHHCPAKKQRQQSWPPWKQPRKASPYPKTHCSSMKHWGRRPGNPRRGTCAEWVFNDSNVSGHDLWGLEPWGPWIWNPPENDWPRTVHLYNYHHLSSPKAFDFRAYIY